MKIIATRQFEKDVKRIPKDIASKVKAFTLQIKEVSDFDQIKNSSIRHLIGDYEREYYRLRIGNYRLGFSIENNVVYLNTVKPRGEIYKHFPPKKNKRKK